MTKVILPKLNQTGANEWADVEDNDRALRDVINGQLDNENLSGSAGITRANLAAESKPLCWYTPKIIATEESRTSTEFGTLTTPDEIKEVVLPENGLLAVGYQALWKEGTDGNARVAIFLGANQLKVRQKSSVAPAVLEAVCDGTANIWSAIATSSAGFQQEIGPVEASHTADVTTGQVIGYMRSNMGSPIGVGGLLYIFAAAGTYNVSVQFKVSSGSVTVKARKLWCMVFGY